MVQLLLKRAVLCATLLLAALPPTYARKPKFTDVKVPELLLEGGRRLVYERSYSTEHDVKPDRGFWDKVVDVVAGDPEYRFLVRPYSIVADSKDRIIITDPGSLGIHIFDFTHHKYKFISHTEGKERLRAPQCVTVDREDNIYVTDSEEGKIFVFNSSGKFKRAIGSLKGGEGYFKRPTGIAVDLDAQRIYVADTWRDSVLIVDMEGTVLKSIGRKGQAVGDFNFPTELKLSGDKLFVVDALNFRIQVFDRKGTFLSVLGRLGDGRGELWRPKGMAVDSEGHIYLADALFNIVQVFDREGQLLYYFGKDAGVGDFQLPSGVAIDRNDRIFVVDSSRRRIQVFHYYGLPMQSKGTGK
jgi:DNA-binding beta-propeller fold protein YncE